MRVGSVWSLVVCVLGDWVCGWVGGGDQNGKRITPPRASSAMPASQGGGEGKTKPRARNRLARGASACTTTPWSACPDKPAQSCAQMLWPCVFVRWKKSINDASTSSPPFQKPSDQMQELNTRNTASLVLFLSCLFVGLLLLACLLFFFSCFPFVKSRGRLIPPFLLLLLLLLFPSFLACSLL